MANPHPVHSLRRNLEAERLRAVEALAAGESLDSAALLHLASLQAALTAVREEIEAQGVKLGWGGEDGLS